MKGWTRGAGLAIMIAVLVLAGCNKKQGGESEANMASLGSGTGSAAGTRWAVPKRWVPQGERPMRAATYAIPAPAMKVFPVPHSPTILTAS